MSPSELTAFRAIVGNTNFKKLTLSVEAIPVDKWIILYGIPSFLLNDNGAQLVAKLFEKLCVDVEVKSLTMIAYHSQINCPVERYSNTLITRLRHPKSIH